MFSAKVLATALALGGTNVLGGKAPKDPYKKDFDYPKNMPRPPMLWVEGFASRLHAQEIYGTETPVAVWQTQRLDQAMWNCIARYHPDALDALTKAAPSERAPEEYHTSEARALCMVHAVNALMTDLVPQSADMIASWLDDMGLESSYMDHATARSMASGGDPTPRVLGTVVAADILDHMQTDGWNYDGAMNNHGSCSFNCRRFSDTTGYKPRNSPWEVTVDDAWQPLIEHDDKGFFYVQEHVTPHIGFTATPYVLDRSGIDARTLADPGYDYSSETDDVIDTVGSLNDMQTVAIEFMDNKINLAGDLIMRLREFYSLSLEAQVFYHYGYTSVELDTVLLAWKEKINHDLIRTTTKVQARGADQILSYDGSTINAYDWHAYMRVMPHAEYPSGSGCICTGVYQYVDAYVNYGHGDTSFATDWFFEAGSNSITDGPASDITLSFANMEELRDMCGDSRLWGGMHFSAAVPDSYDLCDNVGTLGLTDLMAPLLGSGSYADLMDPDLVELFGTDVKKGKGKGKGKRRSLEDAVEYDIPANFKGTSAHVLKKASRQDELRAEKLPVGAALRGSK